MRVHARRVALAALAPLVLASGARAQQAVTPGRASRALEVVPDTTSVTVGQPVTLRVRVRLAPGDSVGARALTPLSAPPEGIRILAQDSLTRGDDGALEGRLRVAFFRPGKRAVPPLVLPYAPRGGAKTRVVSPPVVVDVVRVLPPGDQALRDIADVVPLEAGGPPLWLVVAAMLAAALLGWWLARRLRRRRVAAQPAATGPPPDPYGAALARLAEIERAGWPRRGEVTRHYDATAEVLRRYLEDAHGVPALELTTTEVAWALPPVLAEDGRRDAACDLLERADLVKFARVRPAAQPAQELLADARELLTGWHEASRRAREAELQAALAATARAGAPSPTEAEPEAWRPPSEAEEWGPRADASESRDDDALR